MSDIRERQETEDREDDATSSHTLDQIEEEENVPAEKPDSDIPSPDEGSGRDQEDGGAGSL
jgi:hypothetical protein